jgi:hypothetical protein
MNFTLYYLFGILIILGWWLVLWVHGLVRTESKSIAGFMWGSSQLANYSLITVFAVWCAWVCSPVAIVINLAWGTIVTMVLIWVWPIVLGLLGLNLITGIINHLMLRQYSRKRWGTDRPDYRDWNEFDEHAHRPGSTVYMNLGGNSYSPFKRGESASLAHRASSKSSASHRSTSSSGSGASHRSAVVPIFMPVSTRSSGFSLGSSHRSSGSGKISTGKSSNSSGKGCGGLIAAILAAIAKFLQSILMFLVQILIVLALVGVTVLFFFLGYKVTQALMEHYDEEYVLEVYKE